jgi:hypothetical protein
MSRTSTYTETYLDLSQYLLRSIVLMYRGILQESPYMYQTLGLNLLLLLAQNRLAEFHTVGYASLFLN